MENTAHPAHNNVIKTGTYLQVLDCLAPLQNEPAQMVIPAHSYGSNDFWTNYLHHQFVLL